MKNIDLSGLKLPRIAEQISRHVQEVGECLEWTGYLRGTQPQMRVTMPDGRHLAVYVRRVQWVFVHGCDPGKRLISTSCDNPRCIRHLKAITKAQASKKGNLTGRALRRLKATAARRRRGVLTEEVVREIRSSPESNVAIAQRLGCHQSTVAAARCGRTWRTSGVFSQLWGSR